MLLSFFLLCLALLCCVAPPLSPHTQHPQLDSWSVGALAYDVLCGRAPFAAHEDIPREEEKHAILHEVCGCVQHQALLHTMRQTGRHGYAREACTMCVGGGGGGRDQGRRESQGGWWCVRVCGGGWGGGSIRKEGGGWCSSRG